MDYIIFRFQSPLRITCPIKCSFTRHEYNFNVNMGHHWGTCSYRSTQNTFYRAAKIMVKTNLIQRCLTNFKSKQSFYSDLNPWVSNTGWLSQNLTSSRDPHPPGPHPLAPRAYIEHCYTCRMNTRHSFGKWNYTKKINKCKLVLVYLLNKLSFNQLSLLNSNAYTTMSS